jgi:tRNA(fMet)-specific endonuclease VapC
VTVGELRFGASKSAHQAKNNSSIDEFLHFAEVEYIDHSTAVRYGELKAFLRRAGKPIPDNDLWIAATAIEHHLVLVTRDKHFELIPGLAVETW